MAETLAHREYSGRAIQHDRVKMIFKNLQKLVLCMKVASALEGLIENAFMYLFLYGMKAPEW